jgi:hypothetical protein
MPESTLSSEEIWEKVMAAHLIWTAEIERRLDVDIGVYRNPNEHVFWYGQIRGKNEDQAQEEMDQLDRNVGALHYSIQILWSDTKKLRDHNRKFADLRGLNPWDALIAAGMECIEAVLIGPDARAAEVLAADPRLLAAARYRVLDSHELDSFTPHVRRVIALADSILAAKAFDEVLNGSA